MKKTAEEHLQPYLSKNIKGEYLCKGSDAIKAMKAYAAQEVERVKRETCKWQKEGLLYNKDCDTNGKQVSTDDFIQFGKRVKFIYCPSCGRKIEWI